jgi:predicted PurR-regulated permease PerM
LENNLIMPVVVGGQLKLHPVAVIFSMLLCVTTFGVLGVLIAMPTVAIFLIFHEEVYRPHFLPHVCDADLERIARATLEKERVSLDEKKPDKPREPKET